MAADVDIKETLTTVNRTVTLRVGKKKRLPSLINSTSNKSFMTFQNAPRWSPGTRMKCHIAAIGGKIKSPGVST